MTVPCIMARGVSQWDGKVPGGLNVCENVFGAECAPESQLPSGEQFPPGQAPDVVGGKPLAQLHVTVSPEVRVVVLVPLWSSLKLMPPPCPTSTWCVAAMAAPPKRMH